MVELVAHLVVGRSCRNEASGVDPAAASASARCVVVAVSERRSAPPVATGAGASAVVSAASTAPVRAVGALPEAARDGVRAVVVPFTPTSATLALGRALAVHVVGVDVSEVAITADFSTGSAEIEVRAATATTGNRNERVVRQSDAAGTSAPGCIDRPVVATAPSAIGKASRTLDGTARSRNDQYVLTRRHGDVADHECSRCAQPSVGGACNLEVKSRHACRNGPQVLLRPGPGVVRRCGCA